MTKYKLVDLCCGIGGIRLGFEKYSEFETAFANDIDKNCKIVYDTNFASTKLTLNDINSLNKKDFPPKFDILTAGFPCQSFSIAGKRLGFNDYRGNVFFRIARIIKTYKPSCILLENVKNLESHDGGKTFKIIKNTLEKMGYHIKHKILNTKDYTSIPQNRERIFIIGFLSKKSYDHFNFPKPISKISSFKTLLETNVDKKYHYTDKKIFNKIKNEITSDKYIYQYRRYYVRCNKKGMCPTLTANMGTGGHNVPLILQNGVIRKFTPRECFNFQGFPSSYILPTNVSDAQLYKQAGNSVSVPIIEKMAKNILFALKKG